MSQPKVQRNLQLERREMAKLSFSGNVRPKLRQNAPSERDLTETKKVPKNAPCHSDRSARVSGSRGKPGFKTSRRPLDKKRLGFLYENEANGLSSEELYARFAAFQNVVEIKGIPSSYRIVAPVGKRKTVVAFLKKVPGAYESSGELFIERSGANVAIVFDEAKANPRVENAFARLRKGKIGRRGLEEVVNYVNEVETVGG